MTVSKTVKLVEDFLTFNNISYVPKYDDCITCSPLSLELFKLLIVSLQVLNIEVYTHPQAIFNDGLVCLIIVTGYLGDAVIGVNYNKEYYSDS